MSDIRWFLANRKSDDEVIVKRWAADLRAFLQNTAGPDYLVTVIDGKTDFDQHAVEAGGWKLWPTNVVNRIDPTSRRFFYDGVCVPISRERGLAVGKVTDTIINGFLRRADQPGEDGYVAAWNIGSQMPMGNGTALEPSEVVDITGTSLLAGGDWTNWSRIVLAGVPATGSRLVVPSAVEWMARIDLGTPAAPVKGPSPRQPSAPVKSAARGLPTSARTIPDWQQATSRLETLIDVCREVSADIPDAADFCDSVSESATSMAERISKFMSVRAAQLRALANWEGGVARWQQRRERDDDARDDDGDRIRNRR